MAEEENDNQRRENIGEESGEEKKEKKENKENQKNIARRKKENGISISIKEKA